MQHACSYEHVAHTPGMYGSSHEASGVQSWEVDPFGLAEDLCACGRMQGCRASLRSWGWGMALGLVVLLHLAPRGIHCTIMTLVCVMQFQGKAAVQLCTVDVLLVPGSVSQPAITPLYRNSVLSPARQAMVRCGWLGRLRADCSMLVASC